VKQLREKFFSCRGSRNHNGKSAKNNGAWLPPGGKMMRPSFFDLATSTFLVCEESTKRLLLLNEYPILTGLYLKNKHNRKKWPSENSGLECCVPIRRMAVCPLYMDKNFSLEIGGLICYS